MEDKIENESQKQSPFKIYEDKHCSNCEDYRGCIGLIDSMAMDTNTNMQNSKKSGFEMLDSTTRSMIDSAVKGMTNMTFTMRFKLILDCMNMRKYLETYKKAELYPTISY